MQGAGPAVENDQKRRLTAGSEAGPGALQRPRIPKSSRRSTRSCRARGPGSPIGGSREPFTGHRALFVLFSLLRSVSNGLFSTLSSSGLGHRPFTAVTRVRIPLGSPWVRCLNTTIYQQSATRFWQVDELTYTISIPDFAKSPVFPPTEAKNVENIVPMSAEGWV